jgi:hypothetical protein
MRIINPLFTEVNLCLKSRHAEKSHMQIFLTDIKPQECAEALDDLALKEQIDDMTLLLRAADEAVTAGGLITDYPWLMWTWKSRSNAAWAFAYAMFLNEEHAKRLESFGPNMAEIDKWRYNLHKFTDTRQSDDAPLFPTEFVNASTHQDVTPPHMAYRMMLNDRWDTYWTRPVWSNRKPPEWARRKSFEQKITGNPALTTRYHYEQMGRKVRLGND